MTESSVFKLWRMSRKLKQICIVAILLCFVVLARYFMCLSGKSKCEFSHIEKNDLRNRDRFEKGYEFPDSKSKDVKSTDVAQLRKQSTEKGKETLKQTMVTNKTSGVMRQHGAVTKYDIILSAYQHSGSSVTGKLFGNREDTFYFYEPLWEIATHTFYKGKCLFCRDFKYTNNDKCIKVNKTCNINASVLGKLTSELTANGEDRTPESKIWNAYHKTLEESVTFLQGIFDCKFLQFADFFYDPTLHSPRSLHMYKLFSKRVRWGDVAECKEPQNMHLKSCLELAEKTCNKADHRVIKSLRMTLDNVIPLLGANPRIKVVHLFRDPRGIFNSRVGDEMLHPLDDQKLLRLMSAIKTTCDRHRIDLQATVMLSVKYPDRFKAIQYENLYAEPMIKGVKELYEFAGMDYGSEQQLEKQLDSQIRKESEFHPFKYRTTLPWSVVAMFNKECSDVLDRLGYTRFKNKSHLEDLSQSGFALM